MKYIIETLEDFDMNDVELQDNVYEMIFNIKGANEDEKYKTLSGGEFHIVFEVSGEYTCSDNYNEEADVDIMVSYSIFGGLTGFYENGSYIEIESEFDHFVNVLSEHKKTFKEIVENRVQSMYDYMQFKIDKNSGGGKKPKIRDEVILDLDMTISDDDIARVEITFEYEDDVDGYSTPETRYVGNFYYDLKSRKALRITKNERVSFNTRAEAVQNGAMSIKEIKNFDIILDPFIEDNEHEEKRINPKDNEFYYSGLIERTIKNSELLFYLNNWLWDTVEKNTLRSILKTNLVTLPVQNSELLWN